MERVIQSRYNVISWSHIIYKIYRGKLKMYSHIFQKLFNLCTIPILKKKNPQYFLCIYNIYHNTKSKS